MPNGYTKFVFNGVTLNLPVQDQESIDEIVARLSGV